MKASIKFRDDQKPLFRAKVPLNILGFPFQSGIEAGDSKELSLNLSTFFESCPSLKVEYRPNDPWNPFSLVVKSGVGHLGSPISSPMTMSAEFNFLGRGNPSFLLHFRPMIGDFSIKKSARSPITLPSQSTVFVPKMKSHSKDVDSDTEGTVDGGETPFGKGVYPGEKINGFSIEKKTCNTINSLSSGVEVNARTVLPVRSHAKINFRWGIGFPAELMNPFSGVQIRNPTAKISHLQIPFLVLNKIGIEHVAREESRDISKRGPASADLAETCFTVKRQLEVLQSENVLLRKAMEELRSVISTGKCTPSVGCQDSGEYKDNDMRTGRKPSSVKNNRNNERKTSEFCGSAGKVTDEKVNEELKKTLNGAT